MPRPWYRWALAGLMVAAPALSAQDRRPVPASVVAADSAFGAGDIERAESLYYIGVRERPRDPLSREALGRYLAARGATKVAIVLLEEARMFGGDPARIAGQLSPLYQSLGDWRALLTLPASSLGPAERRRAGWLAEHPFGSISDTTSVAMSGVPARDTIARVPVWLGRRMTMMAILGTDAGFVVPAGTAARRFDGDSATVVVDSLRVGTLKLINVPAGIGTPSSPILAGVAAFNRLIPTIDYSRNRISFARTDAGAAGSRFILVSMDGHWRVLEGGRWRSLGAFAESVARAKKSMTVDVRAGEVRVRP